ncbi:hypothetical protein HYW55_01000 [Candidatus Gottesmanbacteria bacterium]|nr:hypothetical protein [Candidatus Gottesmanbacteria bacterium]
MRVFKWIPVLILPVWIFFAKISPASAQTLSLSISPPLLEVMIKPGKSITQVYKLTNNGETTIITARIAELGVKGIEEDPTFQLENWIGLVSSDTTFGKPFLLERGKTKEFILKINPPESVEEKDYYRVLLFTTKPNPPSDNSQSQIAQTLGSPLLITTTKTGLLNKNVEIVTFDVPKIIDSFGPLQATIAVSNTGSTYTRPVGTITLKGLIGRGTFEISPRIIMAGQKRNLTTEISSSNDPNSPTIDISGIYFGPYTLTVDFTLDQGTITLSQTKKFYALPWKLLLVLFVIILFVVVVRTRRRKVSKK